MVSPALMGRSNPKGHGAGAGWHGPSMVSRRGRDTARITPYRMASTATAYMNPDTQPLRRRVSKLASWATALTAKGSATPETRLAPPAGATSAITPPTAVRTQPTRRHQSAAESPLGDRVSDLSAGNTR